MEKIKQEKIKKERKILDDGKIKNEKIIQKIFLLIVFNRDCYDNRLCKKI